MWRLLLMVFVGVMGVVPAGYAQEEPNDELVPKTHVVAEGETLTSIAGLYDTTAEAIAVVNGLGQEALIFVGQALIIPGIEGELIATTYTVQGGDTLAFIAESFNTTADEVAGSNGIVNPAGLYVGQVLTIISHNGSVSPTPLTGTPHLVRPGETLLQISAQYSVTIDDLLEANGLPAGSFVYPGLRLRIPSEELFQGLNGEWRRVVTRPGTITQGQTTSIYVETLQQDTITGEFAGQTLNFLPYLNGYVALVGLDAFAEPGRGLLQLNNTQQTWEPFTQPIAITAANYPTSTITLPDSFGDLLDPAVRANEDAFLATIFSQITATRYWDGLFQFPVSDTFVTAPYGDIRSYNGGPFNIFHTGIDYAGTTGTPILAPANGIVAYTETVQLRGLILIIDHGWGVMSGYYHLSDVNLQVGDPVRAGQVIAAGGSTGLSTGPHLHWDLRIHGVAVDGLQWVNQTFP